MNILGISFLADASAVLFRDGKLIAAIGEERLNRIKLWNGVPMEAIEEVLILGGISLQDVDVIATHGSVPGEINWSYFEKKIDQVEQSSLDEETKKIQIQVLKERYDHENKVSYERTPGYLKKIEALGRPMKLFGHHESHAAGAFYGSPWEECLVLTCDGWGEDGSASIWWCDSNGMKKIHETSTIDSLGYFYGGLTEALGFKPERHEGKILGLAAYEKNPKSYKLVKEMISYDSIKKTFLGHVEKGIYLPRFNNPNLKKCISDYTREDWSSAAQKRLEEVVCECVRDMGEKATKIALAGGVFANVKLNQRICELSNVNEVFVFPNMGDGGLGYGAAAMAMKEISGHRIHF